MKKLNIQKGFTLIELIVVIAVLGILSSIVIVAVNPLEQLARGRDSSRKSTISQLGRAAQNYYTSQSSWVAANNSWQTNMSLSGDIKSVATNPSYASGAQCVTTVSPTGFGIQGNYCYATHTINSVAEAIIYARLESTSDTAVCASGQTAWYVWYSGNGSAGRVCTAAATTMPVLPAASPWTFTFL